MANRTKKDATEALSHLATYLRRDRPGREMLESIRRYIGDLRRIQTALKAELKAAKEQAEPAVQRSRALSAEVATLRSALSAQKIAYRQKSSELIAAMRRHRATEQELEKEREIVVESHADCTVDVRRFIGFIKELRKRMKRPPRIQKVPGGKVVFVDVCNIVKTFTIHEVTTLGLLTCVSAIMGFNIGYFSSRESKNSLDRVKEKTGEMFFSWAGGDWLGDTATNNEIWTRTAAHADDGGPGEKSGVRNLRG